MRIKRFIGETGYIQASLYLVKYAICVHNCEFYYASYRVIGPTPRVGRLLFFNATAALYSSKPRPRQRNRVVGKCRISVNRQISQASRSIQSGVSLQSLVLETRRDRSYSVLHTTAATEIQARCSKFQTQIQFWCDWTGTHPTSRSTTIRVVVADRVAS